MNYSPLLLAAFFLHSARPAASAGEIKIIDPEGQTAWLYTPTDAPDPDKTYWFAVGVHGAGGKGEGAAGIASWAEGNVLVLGPTFRQAEGGPKEVRGEGMPVDSYQMAGPSHVAKLKALVAEIGGKWKLHPRVFLHGFSAGAQFVHRFAMREPDMTLGVSAASAGTWSNRGYGEINPAAACIPFALSCGEQDRDKSMPAAPLSRVEWMKDFAADLGRAHFDVTARVIENSGHRQQDEGLALARSCFERARGLRRSPTAMVALDFNGVNPLWDLKAAAVESGGGHRVTAAAAWVPDGGSVEQAGTANATGSLRLRVNSGPGAGGWSGSLTTGLLPVRCPEADAALLTLAFDLKASSARPVEVLIESYDAAQQRTGGLAGLVVPAAVGFLHRHTLDPGTMQSSGGGTFRAQDPFVRISFRLGSVQGWADAAGHELLIDNLSWTAPAWYVGPEGKDAPSRGRTAADALGTVQQAVDRAGAGDVVVVLPGTYATKYSVAHFKKPGEPAAWLVLRSLPGGKVVFRSTGWDCIKIGQGSKTALSTAPATAYVELRSLTIQGDGAEVAEKYKDKIGKPEPETNGNGISIDGRFEAQKPHHLRVVDCTIFDVPGGGISAIHADRVSVESNHTFGNCHWMIYAGSGISVYQPFNFEATPDELRILVRNNRTHDNYCTQPWTTTGKISDGNGLIVDDTRNTQNNSPNGIYHGRLLLQGNVSYRNGGSGMHAFSSDRVDFINNTAVGNNVNMDYSQIGITRCSDCRVLNNLMVAPADKPVNRVNGNSEGILISHNLFFGGNGSLTPGEYPVMAEPQFVDGAQGDLRLKAGSPGIGQGGIWEILPAFYQNGVARPLAEAPSLGALPTGP